jgi:hypothetical protein
MAFVEALKGGSVRCAHCANEFVMPQRPGEPAGLPRTEVISALEARLRSVPGETVESDADEREERHWRRRRRREREYDSRDDYRRPRTSSDACSTLAIVFGSIGLGFAAMGWFTCGITFPVAVVMSLTGLILGCCSKSRQKSVGIVLSGVGLGLALITWFLVAAAINRRKFLR